MRGEPCCWQSTKRAGTRPLVAPLSCRDRAEGPEAWHRPGLMGRNVVRRVPAALTSPPRRHRLCSGRVERALDAC